MTPTEKDFLDVIDQEQERILRICRNYSAGRIEQDDLFQEVMLNLWKSFGSFRGESSRSTWVYRVALYTCMAHYRNRKKADERKLAYLQEYDTAEKREEDSHHERLDKAIRQLNDIDRAILILYLEERSYAEIAAIIGISESNAGVRINRIKKRLKQIISQDGNG